MTVLKRTHVQDFTNHLNSVHPQSSLRLNLKKTISFMLYTLVIRQSDGDFVLLVSSL